MSDVLISYKGREIASLDDGGTKTLLTQGKYCEDNIEVAYTKPGGGGLDLDRVALHDFSDYANADVVLTASRINPYAFFRAPFKSVSAPNCIRFTDTGTDTNGNGAYAFANCASLQRVDFPALQRLGTGGYQFYKCTSLTSVHIPNSYPGSHTFEGCTALVKIALQAAAYATETNGYGFLNCTSLEAVDLGNFTKIANYEFSGCTKLAALILRRTGGVTALNNINVFTNTPFASGKAGGTLYVPQALIPSYQAAANWSTILGYANNQILPIEGSIYETQYADGTPVT